MESLNTKKSKEKKMLCKFFFSHNALLKGGAVFTLCLITV